MHWPNYMLCGDEKMRKSLLYLFSAAILGVLITVVPLVTIAQIAQNKPSQSYFSSVGKGLRQLDEGNSSKTLDVTNSEVIVLAVGFIVALLAYGLMEHKGRKKIYWQLGVPPRYSD